MMLCSYRFLSENNTILWQMLYAIAGRMAIYERERIDEIALLTSLLEDVCVCTSKIMPPK